MAAAGKVGLRYVLKGAAFGALEVLCRAALQAWALNSSSDLDHSHRRHYCSQVLDWRDGEPPLERVLPYLPDSPATNTSMIPTSVRIERRSTVPALCWYDHFGHLHGHYSRGP